MREKDNDENVLEFEIINKILNGTKEEIEEEIQKVKREEGERVNYMTFAMKMMEERKEGRKEGQRDERMAILRRLVTQSQLSIEQALDMIGIPEKEQPAYKKMLHTTI